jgi:predicted lipid-binding transport protein (Tim44 family)
VDIYTIIFLALAVFIFLRLRNVLGQRTGNERPPFDRAARNVLHGAQDNNVVPIPGTVIDQAPLAPTADVVPPTDRWKGLAEPGTPLAQGLDAIAAQDSSFDPRHFLSGAKSAYEMIVLAFANGDRRALKDLLSSEVYESFETVIRDREKHEQKTETRFVSIDKAELVGAEARDRAAQLTVRFVSQMITATRDKTGTVVDGSPDTVADITDVWTFWLHRAGSPRLVPMLPTTRVRISQPPVPCHIRSSPGRLKSAAANMHRWRGPISRAGTRTIICSPTRRFAPAAGR